MVNEAALYEVRKMVFFDVVGVEQPIPDDQYKIAELENFPLVYFMTKREKRLGM